MKRFFILTFCLVFIICTFLTFPVSAAVYSNPNETIIFKYLTEEAGFNTSAAVAILGNIYEESSFNTTAIGDQGNSHGLCQWNGVRWDNLLAFCEDMDYDPYSIEGQLQFMEYELTGSYYDCYMYLVNATDLDKGQGCYNAAYAFCLMYERPDSGNLTKEEHASNRAKTITDTFYPHYSGITDLDYNLNGGFGENEFDDCENTTRDFIVFFKSLPNWFSWLPDAYVGKMAGFISDIVVIALVFLAAKGISIII